MYRIWPLLLLIAVLPLAACGGGPSCSNDADCGQGEQCLSSGGVVFGSRVCVGGFEFPPDGSRLPDAGRADVGLPDAGMPSDSGPWNNGGGSDMAGGPVDAAVDAACIPDVPSDFEACANAVAVCGEIMVADGCGDNVPITCGTCGAPDTCQENLCICISPTDAELCALHAAGCGTLTDVDPCGRPRTVNCGVCTDIDSDGVVDDVDNCVGTSNPTQTDANGNMVGDVCEVRLIGFSGNKSSTGSLGFAAGATSGPLTHILFVSWDRTPDGVSQLVDIGTVSGLGLLWTNLATECSDTDGDLGHAIYVADGIADAGMEIDVGFSSDPDHAIGFLAHIDNVEDLEVFSSQHAPCGIDSSSGTASYSAMVDIPRPGDLLLGSVAYNEATSHDPIAPYSEFFEEGNNVLNMATFGWLALGPLPLPDTSGGDFGTTTPWHHFAVVALSPR